MVRLIGRVRGRKARGKPREEERDGRVKAAQWVECVLLDLCCSLRNLNKCDVQW